MSAWTAEPEIRGCDVVQKEVFPELKQELREGVLGGVERVSMRPVLREYAFERSEIPHGRQWVLKVKVPASTPALPLDVKGQRRAHASCRARPRPRPPPPATPDPATACFLGV